MAGTNAAAVRTALFNLLQAALAPVRVDYAYNGRLGEREQVYFGHAAATQDPMVFRAGGRMPRNEELTLPLRIEVQIPGGTPQDTDARATEIGLIVEEALAADPTQTSLEVPGLLGLWISNVTLTPFFMSDGVAASELVYTLTVQSTLG